MQIVRSVVIDGHIEDVFRYVADPSNNPEWCAKVLAVQQAEGEGPGAGARYDVLHRPIPFLPARRMAYTCLEYDPPERTAWREDDGQTVIHVTCELEPVWTSTRLTCGRSSTSSSGDDIGRHAPLLVALMPAGWPTGDHNARMTIEDDVPLPLLVLSAQRPTARAGACRQCPRRSARTGDLLGLKAPALALRVMDERGGRIAARHAAHLVGQQLRREVLEVGGDVLRRAASTRRGRQWRPARVSGQRRRDDARTQAEPPPRCATCR